MIFPNFEILLFFAIFMQKKVAVLCETGRSQFWTKSDSTLLSCDWKGAISDQNMVPFDAKNRILLCHENVGKPSKFSKKYDYFACEK